MYALISGTRVHLRPLWQAYLLSLVTGSVYQLVWLVRTGRELAAARSLRTQPIAWIVQVASAEVVVLLGAATGMHSFGVMTWPIVLGVGLLGARAIADVSTQVRTLQDEWKVPGHRVEVNAACALFVVGLAIGAAAVAPDSMSVTARLIAALMGGIILPFWLLYLQYGVNAAVAQMETTSDEVEAFGALAPGVDLTTMRTRLASHVAREQAGEQLDVRPWATLGLAALCTVVWLWQMLSFGLELDVRELFASGAVSNARVLDGEWWRLFTQHVTHGSVDHWAFNMFSLCLAGWMVERVLGTRGMVAVMVASAGGATLLSWWGLPAMLGARAGAVPALGESGIGFGVIGALVGCDPRARGPIGQFGKYLSLFGLVVTLSPGVNLFAHAGGYAGGLLVALWLTQAQRHAELVVERSRPSTAASPSTPGVVAPPMVLPLVVAPPVAPPPVALPPVVPPPAA
jgi:membrane associated rhomboid family serine protease